jgi:PAS domain S-box-containing protein
MDHAWRRQLWWLLGLASLVALAAWLLRPSAVAVDGIAVVIGGALIAILVNFPIPVGDSEADLAHAVSLALGLALGPAAAGIALAAGLTAGELIRSLWPAGPGFRPASALAHLQAWSFSLARQTLSLFGALEIYRLLGGQLLVQEPGFPHLLPVTGLVVTFPLLFLSLHWVMRLALGQASPDRRSMQVLVLLALLPLPFAIISSAAYALLSNIAFLVLGGVTALLAPIVRNLMVAEASLERRVSELSTLSHVSQTLRSSLELGDLLGTIYQQVAELLAIDNFYVALHDPANDLLRYPMAIKHGQQQHWLERPMADRLTDRVIVTGEPILIPNDAPSVLRSMGMPELENAPEAWLGVPLITPTRTLGCLGVFHTQAGHPLTDRDLGLMETIAGQAGIAIENALLFEQTRQRARALASLSEITASISSSLDPDQTLELVAQSMIQVGGGQKAAIFLLDETTDQLKLAHSVALSQRFWDGAGTFPLSDGERARAFHRRQPQVVGDITRSDLSPASLAHLVEEGITAFVDLPLVTPGATIGVLSVYFSSPQNFDTNQLELLEIFAAQAAVAVSNARRYATADKALRLKLEQLSTLEAFGREAAATLELPRLCEAFLEQALHYTGASIGWLAVAAEGETRLRLMAHRGVDDEAPVAQPELWDPPALGLAGRAFLSSSVVLSNQADLEPDYRDLTGCHSDCVLCVPIIHQSRGLGVIEVEGSMPLVFGEEHAHFLAQLADQASVALTNARLYSELEARLREQSLLFQASSQLAGTLETLALVAAVADSLGVAVAADGVSIYRLDSTGEQLQKMVEIRDGRSVRQGDGALPVQSVPLLRDCLERGQPLQLNLQTCDDLLDRRYLKQTRQIKSILAVPLIVGDERLGIAEAMAWESRTFNENEVRMAQTIASQAAVALQNSDLFRRISESRERLLAVLNSTREGMLMIDTRGTVVVANRQIESMLEIEPGKLTGWPLDDRRLVLDHKLGYHPEELNHLLGEMRQGRFERGDDLTINLSDRVLQRSQAPVLDNQGRLIGGLLVFRDISQERKLEESRQQLTQMIVHDLRSPLTTILGSLKLLEDSLAAAAPNPLVAQGLTISRRSCQQMLGLVNSLLDLARLETGEIPLDCRRFSLAGMLKELMTSYVPEANENGIILEADIEPGLPEIVGDDEKIRRVAANLLDNALKFTPSGGRIGLRAEQTQDSVVVTITDSGIGIPAAYRRQIFERFAQVPGSAGKRRGTGLGLAFSKLAIEAHGGEIWVDAPEAGGSSFHFRLPLKPDPA